MEKTCEKILTRPDLQVVLSIEGLAAGHKRAGSSDGSGSTENYCCVRSCASMSALPSGS